MNIIIQNNEKLLKEVKMEYQLNETLEKLDVPNNILDDTKEELEETNEKLDIAVEYIVVKTKKVFNIIIFCYYEK